MMYLQVGQKNPFFENKPEGCIFNIDDSGTVLVYNFNKPTEKEIKELSQGASFEIRLARVNDILFILTKCGSLPWTDAPYAPQFGSSFKLPESISDNQGYSLMIICVDRLTNIIKSLRMIGLGHDFTEILISEVLTDLNKSITYTQYCTNIDNAYKLYSSEEMAKKSSAYFRLR